MGKQEMRGKIGGRPYLRRRREADPRRAPALPLPRPPSSAASRQRLPLTAAFGERTGLEREGTGSGKETETWLTFVVSTFSMPSGARATGARRREPSGAGERRLRAGPATCAFGRVPTRYDLTPRTARSGLIERLAFGRSFRRDSARAL